MLIIVTEQGFVWQSDTPEVAPLLMAPLCSAYEELTVMRGGEEFDTASIQTVGTHGSYEAFYGLEKIFRGPYNDTLRPNNFQIGDELHIKFHSDTSEAEYWKELSLRRAVPL